MCSYELRIIGPKWFNLIYSYLLRSARLRKNLCLELTRTEPPRTPTSTMKSWERREITNCMEGCGILQTVSHQLLTTAARIQSQVKWLFTDIMWFLDRMPASLLRKGRASPLRSKYTRWGGSKLVRFPKTCPARCRLAGSHVASGIGNWVAITWRDQLHALRWYAHFLNW
jgi:hypothetical protein